jgi:hypothetical protein
MAEFCITCVVLNQKGTITEICLGDSLTRISVQTAIDDIIGGFGDAYYLMKNGKKAQVFVQRHSGSGRWYLTTDPTDERENSLALENVRQLLLAN